MKLKERLYKAFVSLVVAGAVVLTLSLFVRASTLDSRIELSAKQSYIFKTYLQGDDIKIESKDGIVTLTGFVADSFHKSLAQESASNIYGVKSVDNRLDVKGTPPTANSDAWLRDKVKATLLFHRGVNAGATDVDVKDGIVSLRGQSLNRAQQELTTEYAMDIDGVKSVNNEMTITQTPKRIRSIGEKIDDASITTQVKMALLLHRSTSALNTTVATKLGVVTVSGKARTAAAKMRVTKLINDINGVRSVKNRMTIE